MGTPISVPLHNRVDVPLDDKRLKQRDQQAFMAGDTPDEFLPAIEDLAAGLP
jgi:hypothetical protein